MSTVIIDNYDSFTFNLYQLVSELTGSDVHVYRNDKISLQELIVLKPERIILSPGPGNPDTDKDFGVCKEIITNCMQLFCPVLGVCLGHQGIVHHLGGKIIQAPQIVHGKTSHIRVLEQSPLFEGIPMEFEAMRYHSLVASLDSFPAQLKVTASEAQYGLIMAVQHRELPMYGVQFHPESIGTPQGKRIMGNFIERCKVS